MRTILKSGFSKICVCISFSSAAARRQDLSDGLAVRRRVARLDPDPTLTLKVTNQALAGEEAANPAARALSDVVCERRVPRDEVTGVDHEIAVADHLLN